MKFYSKIFSVVFLFCSLFSPQNAFAKAAEEDRAIRFDDLRSIIGKNSELIKSQSLISDAARTHVDAADISYLPVVNVLAGLRAFKSPDTKVANNPLLGAEASIRVYDGGRTKGQRDIRSLAAENLLIAEKMQIDGLLEKSRQFYWQILHRQELLKALNEVIKLNNDNRQAAQRQITAGIATSLDKIEFEMKDVDLKREVKISQMQARNLKRKLAVLLGLTDSENLLISEPFTHDHNWKDALKHGPEDLEYQLKSADFAVNVMNAEAAARTTDSSPEVFGFVDWEATLQANTPDKRSWEQETLIGLRMSLDLNSKKTINREVHAIKMKAESLRIERSQLKRELDADMQNDMDELSLIHTHVHEAEENIKRAENYYNLTQSEYARGVKNSPDVLSATENLFQMKAKYLELIADFQQTKARILFRLGR